MAGEEIKGTADDREIIEPVEGIEELKKRLKEETDRRLAAEARERKANEDLGAARGEVGQTNLQIVESAIEKLKTDRQLVQQAYREARANGDIDAEIEAQTQLADNATKLNQLELGRDAMKANPQQTMRQGDGRTGDPVEDLARTMEREGHQASAEWIRKHPEFARDQKKYAAMIGAHNVAVNGTGLAPNTPEYFAKVEEILGIDPATRHEPRSDANPQPNGHDATSSAATAVRERGAEADKPPAAAPPSRGGGGNAVRLTAAEKEAAQISGISEEEYARNKSRKV